MSRQRWNELWQDDGGFAGSLLNTYTTAKTVLNPFGGLGLIPANYLQVGTKFRFSFGGATSNFTTAAQSMTFQIMVGAVIACTSGAVNITTTQNTLASFKAECLMACTAVGNGTTAKFEGIWDFKGQSFSMAASLANNAGGTGFAIAPLTGPAGGTGFDSTTAQTVDLFVAQSQSLSTQGIRIDYWMFESVN